MYAVCMYHVYRGDQEVVTGSELTKYRYRYREPGNTLQLRRAKSVTKIRKRSFSFRERIEGENSHAEVALDGIFSTAFSRR